MSHSPFTLAVREASSRTKELLLAPANIKFLAYAFVAMPLNLAGKNARLKELERLKPYYTGTRLLASLGIILIAASFLLPFTVLFAGMEGFFKFLIAYILIVLIASIAGIFLEATLDAVYAIKYEKGIKFSKASNQFISYIKKDPVNGFKYMAIKLIIDISIMTLILALYMPALIVAIFFMLYVIREVSAGSTGYQTAALTGMLVAALLAGLALFITAIISIPVSAFYGYYTEESIRYMD